MHRDRPRRHVGPVCDRFDRGFAVRVLGEELECGESYTIAHHVFTEEGIRKIRVAWLRYLDLFAKIDGGWYFAERTLILDWSETRSLGVPTAG